MQVFGRFDHQQLPFNEKIHGAQQILVWILGQETKPRQSSAPRGGTSTQVSGPAQEMHDSGARQFPVLILHHT